MPLFSIVIPAHNGQRYLKEAIRSALSQTRPADEILVIDDASLDDTASIAKSDEWGGKILYRFNSPASGFVNAWNRAARLATGDYVAILHQDDLLHPSFLKQMDQVLSRFPQVSHLYTACNYIDSHGAITRRPPQQWSEEPVLLTGQKYARSYLEGVACNRHIHRCPGVLTSRQLLVNVCQYRTDAGHIADDDFFMRVGQFTDVVGIPAPLASFRNHRESETGKLDDLTMRLARDYVFQSNWHRGADTLLGTSELAIIDLLASKFINLLLFQGLTCRREDWVIEARRLRQAHCELVLGCTSLRIPLWGRPMWSLPGTLAKGYADMIKLAHASLK